MRTILIAVAAVAVLVAAGLWYAFDQNMFGAGDEAVPGERTAGSDSTAPATGSPTSSPSPAAEDGKSGTTATAPATTGGAGGKTASSPTGDTATQGSTATAAVAPSDVKAKAAEATTSSAVPPTAPSGADQGGAQSETPELSFDVVRIAREGNAVLAGRGPPGATITLNRDGKEVAQTKADALGEWVIMLNEPLPEGPGVLGLTARLPDGSERSAPATLAVDVPLRPQGPAVASADGAGKPAPAGALAVLVPGDGDKTTRIMQKPPAATAETPDVTVDKVDYDEAGNVVVAGTAAPGSTVRLYVDNKPVGDTRSNDRGEWTLKPEDPIATGQHALRVDRVVEGGKVAARTEIPFDRAPRRDIIKIAAHRRVIVQPGNSLWRISHRVYGSGMEYTVIYRANASQIRDPDLIYPGQIFNLPAGTTATN